MNQHLGCHIHKGDTGAERWSVFLFFFFPVLSFGMAYYFQHFIGALPTRIPMLDMSILILATYRIIRLFVYDSITQFIREWLTRGNALMRSLGHITSCPWCAGIWFGFGVMVFYTTLPEYFILLILLSVAGAASFLQTLSRMIGQASSALEK
ncbi:MAG: DUF1360 domain-containing protein [Candidatus Moranbacteria bacterium]|nr:DUF1360 domain-containing protein [Candidatus Moranbacteria bacterium]